MAFVSYEDLKVYQLAYRLALEVHEESLKLPKVEQYALGDQIRRASRSICANIAEGLSKQSSNLEECRFLGIARGSCEEMRVWASMGKDFKYWGEGAAEHWRDEYGQVSRMLYALMERRVA